MQYETIDAEQITDIMEGRTPREPQDWGGSGGDASGGATRADDVEESVSQGKSGPIGGPAQEH